MIPPLDPDLLKRHAPDDHLEVGTTGTQARCSLWWQVSGFSSFQGYHSSVFDEPSQPDSRLEEIAGRLQAMGVAWRCLDLTRFESELSLIYAVSGQAFARAGDAPQLMLDHLWGPREAVSRAGGGCRHSPLRSGGIGMPQAG